jgi:hypothetical protein
VFLDVSRSPLVEILANEASNLPLGAVVSAMIMFFLTLPIEGADKARPFGSAKDFFLRLDLGGGILLVASMVVLFLAMQWGGQDLPWGSPAIVGLLFGFVLLFTLFLLAEWKMGEDASVPFAILRQRSMAAGTVYLFFFSMPNFSVRAR